MKIIKYVLILLAVLAIAFVGLRTFTKSHSPSATALYDKNSLKAEVQYCRPYKKNRLIFGGLVPFDKVWRTGANEATLFKINKDIVLAGSPLKAGTYSLWTVPNPGQWQVIINEETGQWGTNYDEKRDVLKVNVKSESIKETLEMLVIEFVELENKVFLEIKWDNTAVKIPIE